MQRGTTQTATANATSYKGMVTSPHWRASEAGVAVLRRGGNAIEALVAAGAALSVLYPHFCGLGGDAVWMVSDAAGKVQSFSGIGQAAQDVSHISHLPTRGPLSALTTACLVDSWDTVLAFSEGQWSGRNRLPTLLEDAIVLAEAGFPVSASQSFWYTFRSQEIAAWPRFSETFKAQGQQRQPELANTLRTIAKEGARSFYDGALAARIAKGLSEAGSPLKASDLEKTRTRQEPPVSLSYRDLMLYAPPPPTQGTTTLAILGILENLPLGEVAYDSAAYYHWLVEAVKQAFLDRHHIGDPDGMPNPAMGGLLDAKRLTAKASDINPSRAMPWPQTYRHGDTALLAAVDAEGRCASLLQSTYFDWGSGVVVGDTGILWQNRGAAFSLEPKSPNRLAPGRRPFYTLNPGLALRNGRPHLLYGTQGADGQPQTLSLLLTLMIDQGLDPLAALSRPRFLLGRTFSDSRDSLKIETNIGSAVIDELAALGHEVSGIDAFSQLGGQAGIIRIDGEGLIEGAHDPRSDGGAIGV